MAQTLRPFVSNIFMIIIFFFFFTINPLSLEVSASIVYKRFQVLAKDKNQPTSSSSIRSLSLHPYSSIVKPPFKNYTDLVLSRLEADKARAKYINSKLHHALSNFNRSDLQKDSQLEDLETSLIGSVPRAWYLARIGVGQPVTEFYLIADTGSNIVWLQCTPCKPCIRGPKFNPSESSSYCPLSCASQLCTYPNQTACSNNWCTYQAVYLDKSFSEGELATETLSFVSSGPAGKVTIGCGRKNHGNFAGAAGIIGLGGTALSLPSQLEATSFSYCLVDMDSGSSSTLEFNSAPPGDSVLVPLIINPRTNIYYYVELTGITIGGELIPMPSSVYQIDQNGTGGTIIDSGTTFTYLPNQVYNSVRDTFVKHTRNLPPPSSLYGLDTCYDLSSAPAGSIPTMSFQFSGKRVLLKQENYLARINDKKFCLAFGSFPVSIIGNIQQQGMRVTYDLTRKLIGFSPNKC